LEKKVKEVLGPWSSVADVVDHWLSDGVLGRGETARSFRARVQD